MKQKIRVALLISAFALTFGLGALSDNLLSQISNEFQVRSLRAANWSDMFAIWPSAGAYFKGMSDGHYLSSKLITSTERTLVTTPEYWQGLAYALQLDSQLMNEVVQTGVVP